MICADKNVYSASVFLGENMTDSTVQMSAVNV